MTEAIHDEMPAEFAVDACQDVALELGGDALAVVVGAKQCGFVLAYVGAEEQCEPGVNARRRPRSSELASEWS